MKKVLALILCFCLCFSFCGCAKKGNAPAEKETNKGNGVDLDKVLKDGKIPELDVTLEMSPDVVKELYNYDSEAAGETGFYIIETRDYTYFLTENASAYYYYKNDKEEEGISLIISCSTACSLACGSFEKPEDVRNAFPDIKFTESEATEEDVFFIPGASDYIKLSYQKENRVINFLFLDNELKAVTLVDLENWAENDD